MCVSLVLVTVLVECTALGRALGLSRSAAFQATGNHILLGHVISTRQSRDSLSCAHACLMHPGCVSFNYENGTNGVCELNGRRVDNSADAPSLSRRTGHVFGQLAELNVPGHDDSNLQRMRFDFTTLDATGRTGPQNISAYEGSSLEGQVQLARGIQIFAAPVDGNYVIEAWGASGANGTCGATSPGCVAGWRLGGLGARIRGTFHLNAGTKLKILVGQEGQRCDSFGKRPGGGGGGSFVTLDDNMPLVIAGGGGGGGLPNQGSGDGDPGQVSNNGSRCGGWGGLGGKHCDAATGKAATLTAGGGAGLTGNGNGYGPFTGAFSFIRGGEGGKGTSSHGGFGGGGFGMTQAGGGGGFSGGGVIGVSDQGIAGGGGSYNGGLMQDNEVGANKGNGSVTITVIY